MLKLLIIRPPESHYLTCFFWKEEEEEKLSAMIGQLAKNLLWSYLIIVNSQQTRRFKTALVKSSPPNKTESGGVFPHIYILF
jgi:hypothetical protein